MAFTDSAHKAIVYFKDGNERTFYSRDKKSSRSKKTNSDPALGINRLKKMINTTFRGKYTTALICKHPEGNQVHKYVEDKFIF